MARPALAIIVLLGTLGFSFHAGAVSHFFEYCDHPQKVTEYMGPRLLDPADHAKAVTLLLDIQKEVSRRDLVDSLKDGGLFTSSPYSRNAVEAYGRVDELCILFATGGVAYVVSEVVKNNRDVLNLQEKEEAIRRAVSNSDLACFEELKARHKLELP